MKLLSRIFIVTTTVLLLAGAGCSGRANEEGGGSLTQLDNALHLYAKKPETWSAAKFNTLYRNPKTPSGYTYVPGAVNYGYGPMVEKNETQIMVHVIAVPKASASDYDKNKYPLNAEKRFETPDYVVYTASTNNNDLQVRQFIETLVYRQ